MMNERIPKHKQQVNTHETNADSTDTGGNTNAIRTGYSVARSSR